MMESDNEDLLPRWDEEAERAVLGALLSDTDAVFRTLKIHPEDFYMRKHQLILRGIYEADARGSMSTHDVVIDILRKRDELELAGGAEYIASLTDVHYVRAKFDIFIHSLKESSLERGILRMLDQIKASISRRDDPQAILEEAFEAVLTLTDKKNISGYYTKMGDALLHTIDDIDKVYKTKSKLCGIPSGFQNLDEMTKSEMEKLQTEGVWQLLILIKF